MFGTCGDGHGGNPSYSIDLSESLEAVSDRLLIRCVDNVLTNNFGTLQCDD
jgi:hypothetical protein